MRNDWNRSTLGVYPVCVLIIVLMGMAGGLAFVIVGGLPPDEVAAGAAIITLLALGAFTFLYVVGVMCLRWFRRANTDRIVIGHMASLIRQKLPLAQGMAIAARSERGMARLHLGAVARPLAAGFSLAESVRIGWSACPGLVLSLILAGERSGQLALAIDQAEQYLVRRARWRGGVDIPVQPYAIVMVVVTGLMVTGTMIAVVPKFKEIFRDFATTLPPVTVALIDVADWFANEGVLLLALLGIAAIGGTYLSLRPRRVPEPRLTTYLADWLRWRTPGLHRLEWSGGLAAALRALRMGLHAGMDLPAAARLSAELDVNVELRWRFARFAELTEQGCDLSHAARHAGLGRLAGLALESGMRGRDMDAAIRYAADYHDALISRWWLVFRSLAWPVTTLVLGSIVAFVVLGLFWPLVALIDSSMGWPK